MNQTSPLPICRIYNQELNCWQLFHTFSVYLQNSNEIFSHQNESKLSTLKIKKYITHDYIAYFSRIIPSAVLNNQESERNSKEPLPKESGDLLPHEINYIFILEDLTLRYSPIIHQDQYIILGFQLNNTVYNETNTELKYIRDLISNTHFHLKYSEQGIVYQVGERVNSMLYKTVKHALVALAELFNIHPSLPVLQKLKQLQKMYHDPSFKDYLDQIVESPVFYQQLTSLTYKTMIHLGMFPSFIELNTMNEALIWVKLKDLVASSSSAPYGANHHASFCIGNFRYSFVFEIGNKEKQKVTINSEERRGFSYKNKSFQYFRIKFLDFFPMDSWVEEMTCVVLKILRFYLDQTNHLSLEGNNDGACLKEYLNYLAETGGDGNQYVEFGRKIAQEFYNKYSEELDDKKNGKTFLRMTQLITEAELKGYSNLKNNCQTIVAEILNILKARFNPIMEPLEEPTTAQEKTKLVGNLTKFGDYFNQRFKFIGPFSLTHRISLLDIFVDKGTFDFVSQLNYGSLHERIKAYLQTEPVKRFLGKLDKCFEAYNEISKQQCLSCAAEDSDLLKSLDLDLENNFELVSCLVNLKSNELFSLKREMKLAIYCREKLDKNKADHRTIAPVSSVLPFEQIKVNDKEFLEMAGKIPDLYAQKYKVLNVLRHLEFYYFNNIRNGFHNKAKDNNVVCFGPIITRNPDSPVMNELQDKEQ